MHSSARKCKARSVLSWRDPSCYLLPTSYLLLQVWRCAARVVAAGLCGRVAGPTGQPHLCAGGVRVRRGRLTPSLTPTQILIPTPTPTPGPWTLTLALALALTLALALALALAP